MANSVKGTHTRHLLVDIKSTIEAVTADHGAMYLSTNGNYDIYLGDPNNKLIKIGARPISTSVWGYSGSTPSSGFHDNIQASSDGQVLRRASGSLGFGSITSSSISDFSTAVGSAVSKPSGQIVYGTGTGITSHSQFNIAGGTLGIRIGDATNTGNYSLVLGLGGSTNNTAYSIIGGYDNDVNTTGGFGAFVFGQSNAVNSSGYASIHNLLVGQLNVLNATGGALSYNNVLGYSNTITGSNAAYSNNIIFGTANTITNAAYNRIMGGNFNSTHNSIVFLGDQGSAFSSVAEAMFHGRFAGGYTFRTSPTNQALGIDGSRNVTINVMANGATDDYVVTTAAAGGGVLRYRQLSAAISSTVSGKFVALNNTDASYVAQISAVNLNSYTKAQSIYSNGNVTNNPTASSYHVWVNGVTADYVSQMALVAGGTDGFFWRGSNAGVFGSWYQVASRQWVSSQSYLTANQTITLSGDVTGSGTTSITTEVPSLNRGAGQIVYGTGSDISSESVFIWDATNKRLGVNKSSPDTTLHVGGSVKIDTLSANTTATEVLVNNSGVVEKMNISDMLTNSGTVLEDALRLSDYSTTSTSSSGPLSVSLTTGSWRIQFWGSYRCNTSGAHARMGFGFSSAVHTDAHGYHAARVNDVENNAEVSNMPLITLNPNFGTGDNSPYWIADWIVTLSGSATLTALFHSTGGTQVTLKRGSRLRATKMT